MEENVVVYQVYHEWRDPEYYEYPQWHSQLVATFSTEFLAEEFANISRNKITDSDREPYTNAEMTERSYTISSVNVMTDIPESLTQFT